MPGVVVRDLKDAEIVPIPKKEDLRRISLLVIVGKLFGQISQDKLQLIAEKVHPESQCGFHKGRGCVDMSVSCSKRAESTVAILDLENRGPKVLFDDQKQQSLVPVIKFCTLLLNMV